MVTNELFDNQSGSYFRELAKFKANEMFLVINKMNRPGNDEERQNVMKKSITIKEKVCLIKLNLIRR